MNSDVMRIFRMEILRSRHKHLIVSDGLFRKTGAFYVMPDVAPLTISVKGLRIYFGRKYLKCLKMKAKLMTI